MIIDNKFEIGDIVYLIHDADGFRYQVVGINIRIGQMQYILKCGEYCEAHYEFEIVTEKPVW